MRAFMLSRLSHVPLFVTLRVHQQLQPPQKVSW